MAKTTIQNKALKKSPTGIHGFDEITQGGLPHGRPSLFCGSAGCGKTLFAMEFLVRGATDFNEPGVFVAFEETPEELAQNVASLGFDLDDLVRKKKLAIDYVQLDRNEIQETGEYDLEGLFIRLNYAIESIGAKRIVLDTIETLFAGLPNESTLRSELVRLFRWLKTKGVTAIITAERGDGTLTRHGLEEYVADCVVLLDHRVTDQISTRRLRVVKYRGSVHGTNEYPFLIGKNGLSVLPVTSLELNHKASTDCISSGIARLDTMLGGKGFYRGSSVLISGTAGSGKSTLSASFVAETCRNGGRALYFAFEESQYQIMRNMRSVGIDLEPYVKKGLLTFHAARPTYHGLEMHLVTIHDLIARLKPDVVVIDPVTNLIAVGTENEVRSMLTRLIDFLKMKGVTSLFTSLTTAGEFLDTSAIGISSLMDTWLLVRNLESGGERNRALYILKSRGMAHSNQVREFRITDKGIDLVDVYIGNGEVFCGTARIAQQAREKAEEALKLQQLERKRRDFERKRTAIEAQITALRAELDAEKEEVQTVLNQEKSRMSARASEQKRMAELRKAD
jgi:circadian clock protein KaiC